VSRVLPKLKPLDPMKKVVLREVTQGVQSVIARSMGWHVPGVAPLGPDFDDVETIVGGAKKRLLGKIEKMEPEKARRFREFVRVWLDKNVAQLPPDQEFDFEEWLAGTHYSEKRKEHLRKARVYFLQNKDKKNKSFVKHEWYDVPKWARWINSRTDAAKTYFGPFFKAIEKVLYRYPAFIKHVPVEDRAKYIKDMLYRDGATYLGTDHSNFELHDTPEIMSICELQLYSHVLGKCILARDFLATVHNTLPARQTCANKRVVLKTWARMSGDMCTSLGNGFVNLMAILFIASENGWLDRCQCVVEGDDAVLRKEGPMDVGDFEALSFDIKLTKESNLGKVGFCCLFFSDDKPENLVDPVKVVARSGWTNSVALHGGPRIMASLSRAKAFSLLCEAPTNPITSKMALWILRATEGVKTAPALLDRAPWWAQRIELSNVEKCIEKARAGPSNGQRVFVAEKWGIPISDQIEVEKWFDQQNELVPMDHPALIRLCKSQLPWWAWSWDTLSSVSRVGDPWCTC